MKTCNEFEPGHTELCQHCGGCKEDHIGIEPLGEYWKLDRRGSHRQIESWDDDVNQLAEKIDEIIQYLGSEMTTKQTTDQTTATMGELERTPEWLFELLRDYTYKIGEQVIGWREMNPDAPWEGISMPNEIECSKVRKRITQEQLKAIQKAKGEAVAAEQGSDVPSQQKEHSINPDGTCNMGCC